jgi:hypothetical protein
LAAVLIFLATYLVLAIGRLPGFRVDRTGACIIGASLMIAFGVLDFQQAFAAIDYDTNAGYVYHAGGQSDHPRFRRESDRSPESAPRSADRFLGVLQGRRTVDGRDHRRWSRLVQPLNGGRQG